MYNVNFDLRGKRAEDTYQQLVQYDSSSNLIYDGQGNGQDNIATTASYSTIALFANAANSASYTPYSDTSIFANTASVALVANSSSYNITSSALFDNVSSSVTFIDNGGLQLQDSYDDSIVLNLNVVTISADNILLNGTSSVTGSLLGTASYAFSSDSSSFTAQSNSSSYSTTAGTSVFSTTSSYSVTSSFVFASISTSYSPYSDVSMTSSYLNGFTSSLAPVNTIAPVTWSTVSMNGQIFFIPLYQ